MPRQQNKAFRDFLVEVGGISDFTAKFFREGFKPRYEWSELVRQCYIIGYKTLPLVGITAFIMGLVLTVQSRPTLEEFGAESFLPSMVALSVIREIGPVITALICAGKIGSSIGAELGSMRVTEQIDAMEVSGTNPFKYLVVTRVVACTLMLPILVVVADFISLYASYIGVNFKDVVSIDLYYNKVFDSLVYGDVLPAIIKTYFFGFAIGIIGCYKGYFSNKGTEGVGIAANSAVVVSSLVVFILDLIAVQIADIMGLT
ncbi:MAG: ABC transporter permease [Bacteroidetes bacterium]|nr:ABC transporter permease [Bacteroidota bacterium]MBK9399522.1 ABC transporter permease [Bacteroidota bacterium]MBL0096545.1 ABC transporter permease [Bacteroidota bacterium]